MITEDKKERRRQIALKSYHKRKIEIREKKRIKYTTDPIYKQSSLNYYYTHRESILKKRRDRYMNDSAYRDRIKLRTRTQRLLKKELDQCLS